VRINALQESVKNRYFFDLTDKKDRSWLEGVKSFVIDSLPAGFLASSAQEKQTFLYSSIIENIPLCAVHGYPMKQQSVAKGGHATHCIGHLKRRHVCRFVCVDCKVIDLFIYRVM